MMRRFILAVLFLNVTACSSTVVEKPTSSEYFELGNEYAKDGLLREAIQAYRRELSLFPKNAGAHRNLGIVYVKAGDYKKAEKHLEECLDEFEDNFDVNFYLAETYRAREKFGDAIFRYKRALEIRPDEPRSLKALAWSYYKIRYYSESLKIALKLKPLTPADSQVAIIIGRTLLKLERPQKAIAAIRKAQALATPADLPYLQSVAGDIYRKMSECDKALASYRDALKEQPLLAGALLGLGQCLLETGGQNTTEAIAFMERAIRIKPKLAEGLYLLGKAYEKTDQEKSLKYYKQFRKQASSDPEYLSLLSEIQDRINALSKTETQKEPQESKQL